MAGETKTDLDGRRGPGRPPNTANRRAILEATRAVLVSTGYERMTLEAVAQEAGLYRRYINRTWSSKAELVRDALFDDVITFESPDLGDLRSDLRAVITQHVDLTLRPDFLRGLPAITAEFRLQPSLFQDTLRRHVEPPVTAMAEVFDRAVNRGEINSAPSARVVVSTISGAIQQISLLGLLDRDELINHALAMVLDGLVEPPSVAGSG